MRMIALAGMVLLLTLGSGCGANWISGSHIRQRNVWYGDLGITGDDNDITVARGSRLIKLSIVGDENRVTVEDGVTLNKIKIFGDRNVVSIPEGLIVRVSQAGKANQIVRRGGSQKPESPQPATAPAPADEGG